MCWYYTKPMNGGVAARREGRVASAEIRGRRADYASTRERRHGAWIQSVADESPAWEAGLEAGMRVAEIEGTAPRDIIDWRWYADGEVVDLVVEDPTDGQYYACTLEREFGQDWGVEFEDVLFDGIRTCVNACKFCFMDMLPKGVRRSLLLRDDDYRLSFLQGNFVTLTNVSDEEVDRIIACRLEPMNVSIHAVSQEVRVSLIGRRAMRGIEVLERLLEAGIEVHGQIVLCPGINDGAELERTLAWVERRPRISSLALVPLGYTKYSRRFSSSFSEDREASRAVVELVADYQARARRDLGITRFQLSDEFYLDAGIEVPAAETYDGYPQFYDGIGMLRSFIDETTELRSTRGREIEALRVALERAGQRVLMVCGEAAAGVFAGLAATLGPNAAAYPIKNDYYGGDVNVTGLIVAEDLLRQLPHDLTNALVVLPEPMLNYDRVTLDGVTLGAVTGELADRGARVCVSVPAPTEIVDAIGRLVGAIRQT